MTERSPAKTGWAVMLRWSLPLLVLLTGCSKGPEADLASIGEARSLGAEWALVNEQAAKGHLTDTYVRSMHRWLRENLHTASAVLTQPNSRYAKEIAALMAEPDDAAPDVLRRHSDALKQIEDSLESA